MQGKFGPNWEGSYRIVDCHRKGTCHLETLDGKDSTTYGTSITYGDTTSSRQLQTMLLLLLLLLFLNVIKVGY